MVIDVEVRQRHMSDVRPIDAELREPPRDAAAAVDEQQKLGCFEEVSGAAPLRRERDRSGSQRGETHGQGAPENTILMTVDFPFATNRAM